MVPLSGNGSESFQGSPCSCRHCTAASATAKRSGSLRPSLSPRTTLRALMSAKAIEYPLKSSMISSGDKGLAVRVTTSSQSGVKMLL